MIPEYALPTDAYLDSKAGLIPCKALRFHGSVDSVLVEFTVSKAGFSRGAQVAASAFRVVPRDAVKGRGRSAKIKPYRWQGAVMANAQERPPQG